MRQDRVVALDYIRAIAIILVLLCHWLQGHGITINVGSTLGAVANCMFFVLSGLSLGLSWRKNGCPSCGRGFFVRRLKRIYPAFFMFVIGLSSYLMMTDRIEIYKVVMNLLALSWFAKLPMGGHLWFVTGLLMLYGLIGFASRGRMISRVCAVTVIVGCVGFQIALYVMGVTQGYLLMMLMLGCAGFLLADKFISAFKSINGFVCMTLAISAIFMAVLSACLYGVVSLWIFYWPAGLAAIFLTLSIGAMSLNLRLIPPVRLLADNSYELYLVHYPFSGSLPFVRYVLVSFSVAWVLHKMVGKLIPKRSLKKK